MESVGTSIRIFDGTTDFRVWRARVENELMRYHLLGYIMVRGYDGSQSFTYNGEEVPPRASVVLEVDDQQQRQQSILKEEATCDGNTTTQRERLKRWDVLGESAEAKGILQRFLHPDVESAILNKNIYDSWIMLCAMFGNRSSPGAHDVYEMHRVLYHTRLEDKTREPVRDFISRWEMLMQQYALVTGIELTDAFRSVTLTHTLPSAWRPMVMSWRGVRPYVPYEELVEKVAREWMQTQEMSSSALSLVSRKASSSLSSSSFDTHTHRSVEGNAAETIALVKPIAQAGIRSGIDDKPAEKYTSERGEKKHDTTAEQRASMTPRNSDKRARYSERASFSDMATNTLDLRTGKITCSNKNSLSSPCCRDGDKKISSSRSYRDSTTTDENYEKRHRNDKHESERGVDKYASRSRYDMSPRTSRSQVFKKFESFDRIDNTGPVSCFYCLKVGHHMKHCWYLKADIESGTTHESNKKFTCVVTVDRSNYMVCCLEEYIDEVNQGRAARRASKSTTRRSDYDIFESVKYNYRPQQQELALPPLPSKPPLYAFRDQQQPVSGTSATDYLKRSRSVFQSAEGRILSRDPRLLRKRSHTPSHKRQLEAYY